MTGRIRKEARGCFAPGLLFIISLLLTRTVLSFSGGLCAREGSTGPSGPYLGQRPPGMTPELFAPGIVSNGLFNRDLVVSADGREIFIGLIQGNLVTVLWTRVQDGHWTPLEIVPFARGVDYAVFEPALSPDGKTLYFLTNKAAPGQEERPGWGNQNIFAVDREGGEWGEPYPAPEPITSGENEYYPSITQDGTIYFTHHQRGEPAAIYRSRLVIGRYMAPERLGPEVNCGRDSYNAFIAYDESYIITCANGRDDLIGEVDYYVVFRDRNDKWSEPMNMGEPINLPGTSASSSFVTRDGKYFFFSSDRTNDEKNIPGGKLTVEVLKRLYAGPQNGLADIYWIDAGVIERLRP
ncbi:MAG: PD40 domain-containing protein [Candidatus Krumholzibacteriota bacterium]|nr:PD40 domain-containing protein [Candidatus Krumholzibacteriota bacterium]